MQRDNGSKERDNPTATAQDARKSKSHDAQIAPEFIGYGPERSVQGSPAGVMNEDRRCGIAIEPKCMRDELADRNGPVSCRVGREGNDDQRGDNGGNDKSGIDAGDAPL